MRREDHGAPIDRPLGWEEEVLSSIDEGRCHTGYGAAAIESKAFARVHTISKKLGSVKWWVDLGSGTSGLSPLVLESSHSVSGLRKGVTRPIEFKFGNPVAFDQLPIESKST